MPNPPPSYFSAVGAHADANPTVCGVPSERDMGNRGALPDREQRARKFGATTAATRISEALRELKVGDLLLVDSNGHIHHDKQPFVDGQTRPLVAFTKEDSNGLFIVHAGIPPLNETYCYAARDTHEAPGTPLRYPMVLRSGDQVCLTHGCKVTIPDQQMHAPHSAPHKLQALLAGAEQGDTVSLGRSAVLDCPETVSRVHCTVEVLRKDLTEDEVFELTVRVFPGIPSREPIYLRHAAGGQDQIIGQREVRSGAQIFLGHALGSVSIPHPPGSLEEVSADVSVKFSQGMGKLAREALATYVGPRRGEFSDRCRNNHQMEHEFSEVALLAGTLREYICAGLHLISRNEHSKAIRHFQQADVLRVCGYEFEENNVFILSELTYEAVLRNLTSVAVRSWFLTEQKLVYPSFGVLKKGLAPSNDEERDLLRRWQRDVASVYAEEYTHALQNLLGEKMVSRKAALLSGMDLEADIALFFHEQGVACSREFVCNRYPHRKSALELVGGYQTPETQQLFQEALRRVPVGRALRIGRNVPRSQDDDQGFSIPPPVLLADQRDARANRSHAALLPIEAVLTRLYDGGIEVSPASAGSTVFVPNEAGHYFRAEGPCILAPNTPIYLGRAFRFVL